MGRQEDDDDHGTLSEAAEKGEGGKEEENALMMSTSGEKAGEKDSEAKHNPECDSESSDDELEWHIVRPRKDRKGR